MNWLEMTNPEDLLPEDRFILDVDPQNLINTSPDRKQAWLAIFDTAVAAAEHEKRKYEMTSQMKTQMMMTMTCNLTTLYSHHLNLAVSFRLDNDGGIKNARRASRNGRNTTSLASTRLMTIYQMNPT